MLEQHLTVDVDGAHGAEEQRLLTEGAGDTVGEGASGRATPQTRSYSPMPSTSCRRARCSARRLAPTSSTSPPG